MAIPTMIPTTDVWLSSSLNVSGSSSSKLMNTIIPATNARVTAMTVVVKYGIKNNIAIIAPIGSTRPDNVAYQNAFVLLLVA